MTTIEYEAIKAINFSTLKHMAVSPRRYRWRLEHPAQQKAAFAIGSAVHCAILEPEKFEDRYAVFDGARRGKEWERWQTEHAGVQSLKPDEMDEVLAIAEAVRADRDAAALLRGGRCEEVVTWTDEATGLACKGRLDYIRPDFVLDVKTTNDPTPRKFERSAGDYCYIEQVVFYHDGAIANRLIDGAANPYIVAALNGDDHDVVTFQLDDAAVAYGRARYRSFLQMVLQCTEANWWPGRAPGVQTLSISPWAPMPLTLNDAEGF